MQTGQFIPLNLTQITISDVVTQIEDSELWVNYVPLRISCEPGDIISIGDNGNQQSYLQKGQNTIAAEAAIALTAAKQNALQTLEEIYKKSQVCIIETGDTDPNNNLPIIGKMIMRSDSSGGQLDLLSRQKDLANDYGVSFIQVGGCKLENGIYIETGIMYAGYILREEWKDFYVEILNKSSKNYIIKNKLKDSINSSLDTQTLQYIASTFSSYFTAPFIIDLETKINRTSADITQGDPIFVENLQPNLENIERRIGEIMVALN